MTSIEIDNISEVSLKQMMKPGGEGSDTFIAYRPTELRKLKCDFSCKF